MEGVLAPLREHPLVGEVRGVGLMWGIEIVSDKESRAPSPAEAGVPAKIQDTVFRQGIVSRALGSAIALAPPLIVTPEQIDEIGRIMAAAIEEVYAHL